MNSYNNKVKDFNEQEIIFDLQLTSTNILRDIYKKFEHYKNCWITIKEWRINHKKWMYSQWLELKGSELDTEISK